MPFLYELKIAVGSETAPPTPYTFVQQLVPVGQLVGTGQPIATLTDGAMEYHVPAPRQGLIVEWLMTHNDEVEAGDALARIVCEGESVAVPDARPTRLG